MSILNKPLVLSCNKFWKALKPTTVEKALVDMAKGTVFAVQIEYPEHDGKFDFEHPTIINPVDWETWLTIKPRLFDHVIHTPKLAIRVPTVIVCAEYDKTPMARRKLTNKAIFERDGYICQYTNKKLTKKTATADHVIPLSRGGKTNWSNLVCCHRDVNLKKGNKFNHEAGLTLIRQPKEPKLLPVCANIKEISSPDWLHFIIK